jgi:hypothetical protein
MLIWKSRIGLRKMRIVRGMPLLEIRNLTTQWIRKLDWQQAAGFGGRKQLLPGYRC